MNAPNDDKNKRDDAPKGDDKRSDSEREAEETTDANIAMNDEFEGSLDATHLEEDAGIDNEPLGGDEATDRADTVVNSGIVGRSSG